MVLQKDPAAAWFDAFGDQARLLKVKIWVRDMAAGIDNSVPGKPGFPRQLTE